MVVYKFVKFEHAISTIRDSRIKVSVLDDLNDPFELYSADFKSVGNRNRYKILREEIGRNLGLLCFSKSIKSPLLWSHYADKHRGVALEFSVYDGNLINVDYLKTRWELDFDKFLGDEEYKKDKFMKLLKTKYKQWCYEDEARILLENNDFTYDAEKGINFYDINYLNDSVRTPKISEFMDGLFLTGVILGPLFDMSNLAQIEANLPKGISITISKAVMGVRKYTVLETKKYPKKIIVGK